MNVRLRRGPAARLASSWLQTALTALVAFVVFASIYGSVQGHGWGHLTIGFWIVLVVIVIPWLAGVTAWATVDDEGIHWRYWLRNNHSWDQISRVTLTRREPMIGQSKSNAFHTIVVRARGQRGDPRDEDDVRPVQGTSRGRRAFADAVVAAAQRHGTKVVVESHGWNQPMPEGTDEKTWT